MARPRPVATCDRQVHLCRPIDPRTHGGGCGRPPTLLSPPGPPPVSGWEDSCVGTLTPVVRWHLAAASAIPLTVDPLQCPFVLVSTPLAGEARRAAPPYVVAADPAPPSPRPSHAPTPAPTRNRRGAAPAAQRARATAAAPVRPPPPLPPLHHPPSARAPLPTSTPTGVNPARRRRAAAGPPGRFHRPAARVTWQSRLLLPPPKPRSCRRLGCL